MKSQLVSHSHGALRFRPGPGFLYRAFVYPPEHLCGGSGFSSRTVFFEGPYERHAALDHLAKLLALAYCDDATDWSNGYIENLNSERQLLNEYGWASADAGDLNLLATGCGGDVSDGVGPDRIHYAPRAQIDFFVSPRVRERLEAALSAVDALRAAGATDAKVML